MPYFGQYFLPDLFQQITTADIPAIGGGSRWCTARRSGRPGPAARRGCLLR